MKQITCPLNGQRNISEFSYGGEVHQMPNANTTSDKDWVKYVFYHDNKIAVVQEWWCHTATSYWFIAQRNTLTDEIVKTFDASELFSKRVEFK